MKHRFHLIGLPHTATSAEYNACAYTQKVRKFAKMMQGHECIHYGNEGSDILCEHVQIFNEVERQGYFGVHDPEKLYHLEWSLSAPYWQAFNKRLLVELKRRVEPGDFILVIAGGDCHKPLFDTFHHGPYQNMVVEYGVGYYGIYSPYCAFESSAHANFVLGKRNEEFENIKYAVIPNYFDLDEFALDYATTIEDYFLFVGRIVDSKGWRVAVEVTSDLNKRLIIAGQGGQNIDFPSHVEYVGFADINKRARLMSGAIATFVPTHYREPFGGVAVESQLCGTPAITSDHGAFVETVKREFRCATHKEFVEAARLAEKLSPHQRCKISDRATIKYSLDAVKPLFERYFDRLYSLFGGGWYEDDLERVRYTLRTIAFRPTK